MQFHPIAALLCAALAFGTGSLSHAEQTYVLPQVAPGLWQIDMTKAFEPETRTRWFCIQPGHTDLLPLDSKETAYCTREYRAQADDSVTLNMRCEPSANEQMETTGVFRGDFAQAYSGTMEVIERTEAFTLAGVLNFTTHRSATGRIKARRVGNCTPGVAPCDRTVTGECSDPND